MVNLSQNLDKVGKLVLVAFTKLLRILSYRLAFFDVSGTVGASATVILAAWVVRDGSDMLLSQQFL